MSAATEHIESLLDHGQHVQAWNISLLHHAVLSSNPLAVSALLNAGLLPAEDAKGITPLHLAAAMGAGEICKKITTAYPNERLVCTPAGLNAADFAVAYGHPELLGVLGQPNEISSTQTASGQRPRN